MTGFLYLKKIGKFACCPIATLLLAGQWQEILIIENRFRGARKYVRLWRFFGWPGMGDDRSREFVGVDA